MKLFKELSGILFWPIKLNLKQCIILSWFELNWRHSNQIGPENFSILLAQVGTESENDPDV